MINAANLQKRVLFALIAAPLGWFVINADFSLLPRSFCAAILDNPEMRLFPGHVAIMLIVFVGLFEYVRMLAISFPRNGFWLAYFWLAFQFASYFWPAVSLKLSLDTYLLILVVAAESIFWGRATGRWKRASLLFSGAVFLSVAGFSMLHFYHDPFQQIFPRLYGNPMLSQMGIVVVVFSIVMCDTAAYFIGSLWGKRHFSSISPNKTMEGSIAGMLAAVIISTAGWWLFASPRYSPALGLVMGALIGVFAQAGGFMVSIMKRYFSVKDASDIFPGHGGVLDRFDSLFFSAPILNLFFFIVIRIAG